MSVTAKLKRIVVPICMACGLTLVGSSAAFAQAETDQSDPTDQIEDLFATEEQKPLTTQPQTSAQKAAPEEIKEVSDLGKLSEFSDVAVIQKKFLPKTKRFEAFAAGSFLTNDPFFLNFGANLRLAYYFREKYGVEFVSFALTSSERGVTTDLREKRGVVTSTIVSPKAFYGLDFKWVPVYGKQTWNNRKITPFDLYFSLGLGMTQTNQGSSEPTLHLGTGQAFALSQAMAFRWDFSWNMFQSEGSTKGAGQSLYNNLFLSFGLSFFFPEATYR
ncbi:MAG TPA: outer membrane beta-barrel domain-containing protein [Bdellovibrionales bacterium]|nr:outer membrane beta-barrel domain-containing protein [Bdellovibrionales bacterium]